MKINRSMWISSDEEDPIEAGDSVQEVVADPFGEIPEYGSYESGKDSSAKNDYVSTNKMASLKYIEDSDESTAAMGDSPDGVYRDLSPPPDFEGVREYDTPLHQMRTMEMVRKKHHNVHVQKGPIIRHTARKSDRCAALLKKIKFIAN